MKPILAAALLLLSVPSHAAKPAVPNAQSYHLTLEATPGAPLPFLSRFGSVDLQVYGGGVRAESLGLRALSRTGQQTVTLMNPIARLYTDVPISEMASIIAKFGSLGSDRTSVPELLPAAGGRVRGIPASRYRLQYGPAAWIDVWTTNVVPENSQLRRLVQEFVAAVAPATGKVSNAIPGTPVYVELNFRRFNKIVILRMKSFSRDASSEKEDLNVGPLYARAPIDWLWE